MRNLIIRAAADHFGAACRVEVLRVSRPDRDGLYEAQIRITTPTEIHHWTAWVDGGGVAFTNGRTEPLDQMPLFGSR